MIVVRRVTLIAPSLATRGNASTIASGIHGAPLKNPPADLDEFGIANSGASWALNKVTWSAIKSTMFTAWGALVAAATPKTTIADADSFALADSAASNATKKITWANIKTAIGAGWGVVIAALTPKTTPVDADAFSMADSAAANATVKITWANVKAAMFNAWGALIAAATGKATPVGGDALAISDSAASNATKKLTFANLAIWIGSILGPQTAAAGVKTALVDTDVFPLGDSENSAATKKITFAALRNAIASGWGPGIASQPTKSAIVDNDSWIIADSEAANASKRFFWVNLKSALVTAWGALVAALTSKATPADADSIALSDSAASNATKRLTWANLKAALKTYFDTIYGASIGAINATTFTRGGLVTGAGNSLGGTVNMTVTGATNAQAMAGTSEAVALTPLSGGLPPQAFAMGAAFVVSDQDGETAFAVDKDGLTWLEPAVSGRQVLAGGISGAVSADETGTIRADTCDSIVPREISDSIGDDIEIVSATGSARATYGDGVNTDPHLAGAKVVYVKDGLRAAFSLTGTIELPNRIAAIEHQLVSGQSVGATLNTSGEVLTPDPALPRRAFMFNGGARPASALDVDPVSELTIKDQNVENLVSLYEQNQPNYPNYGESPASGMATRLVSTPAWAPSVAPLVSVHAVGSTPYEGLKKGTVPFRNMERAMLRAALICLQEQKPYTAPALHFIGGESNEHDSKAAFLAKMNELADDWLDLVTALAPATANPLLVLSQHSSFTSAGAQVPLAMLQAAIDRPSEIILACAKYFFSYGDDRHFNNGKQTFILGEYHARAVMRKRAGTPVCLRPISAVRDEIDDRVFYVNFQNPLSGTIALDTTLVGNPGHYGVSFSQTGGTGSPAIIAVGVTAVPNQLQVTFDITPNGTLPTFGFAIAGTGVPGPTTGPRCCIRNTSTDVSLADPDFLLHDYVVHSSIVATP